jgi:hypothetical protein
LQAAAAAGPGTLRLAGLLVRFRLRYLWNGVRARGRGRAPVLALALGLLMSFAYVGLFAQAFAVLGARADQTRQLAALALVAGTIAFGSLAAKAAASEAVAAGSAENEFLLARPIALPRLVAARCLAESATDPLGALFLLPVLVAAALTWQLPPAPALVVAAATSIVAQLGISALAQAAQIAVVRYVPRARRRAAWLALRLLASLALAALWMLGSWVLRAPGELGLRLERWAPLIDRSPGALLVAPLAAVAGGDLARVALALAALAGASGAALLVAVAVARRAGMHGWEEAGASWAEAGAAPHLRAAAAPAGNRRPLTAATKDLRLLARDRGQLVALVAMPIIFVGIQIFGAAGWGWSTASLRRVSVLAFSLTLYMTTIGPLAHMQAERRAFWILRTVPVPIGRLLAGKAKAWSAIVGATAAVTFLALSLGAPWAGVRALVEAALLVVIGAVGMTWLAVGMASRAADLSDDQRPAIGPLTIYSFLLVGALYNAVIAADGAALRARGLVLYGFAIGAYWLAGVERAAVCLDPEAARARRVVLADGAAMLVVYALAQAAAARFAAESGLLSAAVAQLSVGALVGLSALGYLARRPRAVARLRLLAALAVAVAAGVAAGFMARALSGLEASPLAASTSASASASAGVAVVVVAALLFLDELIFRGVIQRAAEDLLVPRLGLARGALLAALAAVALAMVAAGATGGRALVILLAASHAAAASSRAVSGRLSAAWLARALTVAVAVASPFL